VVTPRPAEAYVDATPTLGRLVKDSPYIAVLQVVKINPEKRLILYKKVADLKGRLALEELRQRITDGSHPREPRTIMDWAEPGKTALFFGNDRVAQICLGRYWYECVFQKSSWWVMTRARPELSLAYYGTTARLRQHVAIMLAGRETTITAVLHGINQWLGYETVAFKQSLEGKDVPIGRIRASLTMPDWVGELMNEPHFLIAEDAGGPEEVPSLLQELGDKAAGVRVEAAHNLGLLGSQARSALPDLRKALEDPAPLVRIRAVGAILRIDPEQGSALPVLLEALKDKNPMHRKAAAETLGEVHAREALPALIELLRDQEVSVRLAAVEALGQFGEDAKAAVGPLSAALKDPSLRLVASDVLGRIGHAARPAVAALLPLCQEKDRNLQWSAAVAIIRIEAGEPETPAVRAVVPLFVEGLRSGDPRDSWQAVWCLKWLGSAGKSGVPAIQALAGDENANVRRYALDGLGGIGPAASTALPTIRQHLKDSDGKVRVTAAHALWQISKDAGAAVAVCRADLKNPDLDVRLFALDALGEMGPQAGTAAGDLVEALADRERSIRWAAALALRNLDGEVKSQLPKLIEALKNEDPHVRMMVAKILGTLGPEARPAAAALLALSHERDPQINAAASKALEAIGPSSPAAAIPDKTSDPEAGNLFLWLGVAAGMVLAGATALWWRRKRRQPSAV
jgi:HEAT repeat protein